MEKIYKLDIQAKLKSKEIKAEALADIVLNDPKLLPQLFGGLSIQIAPVKFGCEKTLRIISNRRPQLLYPYYGFFVDMLDSENVFLRCGAIYILGNLAKVDYDNRFEAIFDKYFSPIPGPALIPAASAIGGASIIANAKLEFADRIAIELLKVENAVYQTPECRNVALGHSISAFDAFFEKINDKKAVLAMVERQLLNTRNATRQRAEKFLKRHGK